MNRRYALKQMAAAGLIPSLAGWDVDALAQEFPGKLVRVITPFPAGSGPDAAMRVIGEQMGSRWKQPVVMDNRPGGNGFIAISAFRNLAPDQHQLLMIDSNHATTHPHTFSRLPYDVAKDFVPLGMILRTPFFVAVGANSRYKSIEDIVAEAKSRPNEITYGSWYTGSPGHIGALQLQALTGIQMRHVPYRDFGQLYSAVASGDIDWALGSVASASGLERAGKIRFIGVAASKRDPLYPNVPATAESAALRGFDVNAWVGLFTSPATSRAVVDKIASDLRDALNQQDVVARYRTLGYEAPKLSPSEFSKLIQQETDSWGKVIQSASLKLD